MKKILTSILMAAAVLAGCNDQILQPKGNGGFSVSIDEITDQYITKSEIILNSDEFDYSIVSSTGEVYKSGKVLEMPNVFENVPEGSYTINVSSVDQKPAAFDQPIISGSKDFTVRASEITSVQVACSIQNVKVSIIPDEQFFTELEMYTISVSNGDGAENKLIWTDQQLEGANYETLTQENVLDAKSGYFTVSASGLDIYVTGYRKVSGIEAVYEGVITPIAAKDHFNVKLSAKTTGQIGGGATTPGITITVDYTTVDKDVDVDIPGFEDAPVEGPDYPGEGGGEENEGALSLGWEANPDFGVYELKKEYAEGEVTLKVHADNFIQGFLVKITSPTAGFMEAVKAMATYMDGDVAVLDLFDSGSAAVLGGLGLATGDNLKEKTDVDFSIGGLLPLMVGFGPEVGSIHTFIMEVTDTTGAVLTKELKFEYRGN